MKLLAVFFAPDPNTKKADSALLVLRLWLGLAIFFNHGLDKLMHFSDKSGKFPDVIGIGSTASLAFAVFAEVFCGAFVTLGLVTRLAALNLAITMLVAFAKVHQWKLTGEHSGELAFLYLAGFVTLFIAGPGRFSADNALFKKSTKLPS
jgi:putative oxidoreductase